MERPDRLALGLVGVLFASAFMAVAWLPGQPAIGGLLVGPVLGLALWAFLRALHAATAVEAAIRPVLAWSRVGVVGFCGAVHALRVGWEAGLLPDSQGTMFVLLGVGMVVLAAFMPFIPRNPVFGIRTAWTVSSPAAWRSTHRVGALSFALVGVIVAVAGWAHWVAGLLALSVGNLANLVFVAIWSQRAWAADPEREDPQ